MRRLGLALLPIAIYLCAPVATQAQTPSATDVIIQITASHSVADVVGETVTLGTQTGASDVKGSALEDKIDIPSPPQRFINMAILHGFDEPGWEGWGVLWRKDVRAPVAAGQTKTWNLETITDTVGTMTLSWGSLAALPDFLDVTLQDPNDLNGDGIKSYSMKTLTSFSYPTDRNSKRFSVQITNTLVPIPLNLSGLEVSNVTATGFTVSWVTDQPSTSAVEYGTTADLGKVTDAPGTTTNHTVTVSGLSPNTSYQFRVRSSAPGATDAVSELMTVKTLQALTFVTPPVAQGVTLGQATIHAVTSVDATLTVEYGTEPSNLDQEVSSTAAALEHNLVLTGLQPDTAYTARVTATASGRDPVSSTLSFTTATQAQFSIPPTVTGITGTSATINFATDVDTTALVEYGPTTDLALQKAVTVPGTTHNVVLADLTPGTTYFFRVSATSPVNGTVGSDLLTFTTLAPIAITDVKVVDITKESAVVTVSADTPTMALVEYGTSEDALNQQVSDTQLRTTHSLALAGLQPDTEYKARVRLQAIGRAETVTPIMTFKTAGALNPVDVNGDGIVNIGDVLLMIRFAVRLETATPEQVVAGDLDKNGTIDVRDVIKALRIILRLDPQPQ